MKTQSALNSIIVAVFVMMFVFGSVPIQTSAIEFDNIKAGPYMDRILYKVIESENQQVLALQNGDVDLISNILDPSYKPTLLADPDIAIAEHQRNGYGKFVINCDKYPLNISSFRRAFAFAYNKTDVTETLFNGDSSPIDSPLPIPNPWSIEGELSYSYYDVDTATANALLDAAGFANVDVDAWREAPDGSDFSVSIEVASSSTLSLEIGQRAEDALQSLNINANMVPADFFDFISRVNLHGDFDVVFFAQNFGTTTNPSWMVYQFGSDYYGVSYQNPSNFRNVTFDAWIDQLLTNTTYEGVKEAVTEMQKIIIHSSPEIMIYSNNYLTAYRNDVFEGQVIDVSKGVYSTWTNLKTRLKGSEGGPFGGVFSIALSSDVDTFNFFTSNSANTMTVLDNLYISLFKTGPNRDIIPWLAESYIVETNSDNVTVPAGHTRFTIDIIQNATWSDGTPLDAADVAFSFNYSVASGAYGNPASVDLGDLSFAYSPSPYTAVLEFSTESYWHFDNFAFDYIIPEHIFNDITGIGYAGWNSWNPVLTSDPHVTCGPFVLTDYSPGNFIELTANPFYPYFVEVPDLPSVTGPDDFTVVEGSEHTITWNAYDGNPIVYFVLENGTQVVGDFWFGGNIIFTFNAPSPGVINFTVIVWDGDAHNASDTVLVTVIQDTFAPVFNDEPGNTTFNETESNNILQWSVFDDNRDMYTIFENSVELESGPWTSSLINVTFDGYALGVYNMTLVIQDVNLRTNTSTLFVTIADGTPPELEFIEDFQTMNPNATLIWNATDLHPTTFTVYVDGVVFDSGAWVSGSPVIVFIDNLLYQTYNVTIVFYDIGGNYVSDFVLITAISEHTTTTTSPPPSPPDTILLIALAGIAGAVIVLAVIVLFRRQ